MSTKKPSSLSNGKSGIDYFEALDITTLLESIPLGFFIGTRDDIHYFNSTLCEIFGLGNLHDEGSPKIKAQLKRYLKEIHRQHFFRRAGNIYKIIKFENHGYTIGFLIKVTSLHYIDQFFTCVDFAEEILEYFFLNPYEGLNVVDKNGIIRYMSPTHERYLGIERGAAVGTHATKVIENTRLHIVAKTGKAEIGKTQVMKGEERIVARIPIKKNGKVVGAIGKVMFRDLYQLKTLARKADSLSKQVEYYKNELTTLRQQTFSLDRIIGDSVEMKKLKEEIKKVAKVDLPVLIVGETGTGKELVAHAVHNLSNRGHTPMVTINIAAIPSELFESELFGYEPGSFTNADKKGKPGKFELANGSSIFLDEIGDLPFNIQSKLLRVLQLGYVEKIGSRKPIKSDFRVISATNKDINELLDNRCFRPDLFYRINALTLYVPSLRERKEDIPLLVQHFIEKYNKKYQLRIKGVTDEVIQTLTAYDWPGNVRELENEVGRACCLATSEILSLEDFSFRIRGDRPKKKLIIQNKFTRKKVLNTIEKELIVEALRNTEGNKAQAARLLGLSRTMLYKKIKDLRISI